MTRERVSKIYIILMFAIFLFFTGFKGYRAIFDAKCVAFCVLSLIYIILSLKGRRSLTLAEGFALLYLFFTAISALFSDYFPNTLLGATRFEGLFTVGVYVLVFVFVAQSVNDLRFFVPLLSIVAIVQSLIVILQLLGFNVLWLYPDGTNFYIAQEKYSGAFISTVGNADIASAFFSLITPILWVLCIRYKKYRPLTFTAASMALVCVLFMGVSAGIVAIVMTVIVLLPFVLPKKVAFSVIGIGFVAFFALLFILPLENGTLFELRELLNGNFDGNFGAGRIHIWREVLKNTDNFWLGAGADTMIYSDLEPFIKLVNGNVVTRKIDIAHNDYLNILFHQGIFALVSYLGILITLLIRWYKNRSDTFTMALGAGVFAYCVQTFFSYSACSSAIFFWIVLGLMESRNDKLNS